MADTNLLTEIVARAALSVVLIGAAVAKFIVPRGAFASEIAAFGLLPRSATTPVAATLPHLELALGLALLFGLFVPYVAAGTAVLLGVFTAVVAISLLRRRALACGCFGGRSGRIGWPVVARNLVLIGVAVSLAMEVYR